MATREENAERLLIKKMSRKKSRPLWEKTGFWIGAGMTTAAGIAYFLYSNGYFSDDIKNRKRQPEIKVQAISRDSQKTTNTDTTLNVAAKDTSKLDSKTAGTDSAKKSDGGDTSNPAEAENQDKALDSYDTPNEEETSSNEQPELKASPGIMDSVRHDKILKDTSITVNIINKLASDEGKALAKRETIKVEFWESAIKFKGYRFFRDILELYGMNPAENFQMINIEDNYYLKTAKGVFGIQEQNDYNPFIMVKNREIIEVVNRR